VQAFDIVPKPEIPHPTQLQDLTAVPNPKGQFALFEFTGALPRAKLYSQWQVSTNDNATLSQLGSRTFDPQKTVLVASPLPQPAATPADQTGSVEFASYAPKKIVFHTKADFASVLLLNDKFDPSWTVAVDGKPAELLRCNYIMRGVSLPPGAHTVRFDYVRPAGPLYVSLAAIALALALWAVVLVLGEPPTPLPAPVTPSPAPSVAPTPGRVRPKAA